MTYREFIKIVGYDMFHKMSRDWWNEAYILSKGLDDKVDRYAIWGYKPFYLVNEAYNKAYEKDEDIGPTYDWLSGYPTNEEIEEWRNGNV